MKKTLCVTSLLITGLSFTLTSAEGEITNAYFYDNPDSGCEGFGFNIADGGGFLPVHDITDNTIISMTFGQAVEAAKKGCKVARVGWNGSGMFAYIVPANKYSTDGNPRSPVKGLFPDDMVPYREYWALKTAQNDVSTWAPSGSDSLANDWVIVE